MRGTQSGTIVAKRAAPRGRRLGGKVSRLLAATGVLGLGLLGLSAAASAEITTFKATGGSEQIFNVPAGVTRVEVTAVGGRVLQPPAAVIQAAPAAPAGRSRPRWM